MKLVDGKVYFTTGEVARMFDRSPQWFHYAERKGYWSEIQYKRTIGGVRLISPQNVVEMGNVLLSKGTMSSTKFVDVYTDVSKFPDESD